MTLSRTRVLSMLLSGGTAPLYSDLAPPYYTYPYTMHPPFIGGITIVQYTYVFLLLLFYLCVLPWPLREYPKNV